MASSPGGARDGKSATAAQSMRDRQEPDREEAGGRRLRDRVAPGDVGGRHEAGHSDDPALRSRLLAEGVATEGRGRGNGRIVVEGDVLGILQAREAEVLRADEYELALDGARAPDTRGPLRKDAVQEVVFERDVPERDVEVAAGGRPDGGEGCSRVEVVGELEDDAPLGSDVDGGAVVALEVSTVFTHPSGAMDLRLVGARWRRPRR